MQQTSLDLDTSKDHDPGLVMDPQRMQRLIVLMADVLLALLNQGQDHESA